MIFQKTPFPLTSIEFSEIGGIILSDSFHMLKLPTSENKLDNIVIGFSELTI